MYYSWKPYVPVAARRRKAERRASKALKKGQTLAPVPARRGAIARTFWGKAWCTHLERYSDYASRLPRGRTYLRNGSVIDLQLEAGTVRAQVAGSSLYKVNIRVSELPRARWTAIGAACAGAIDSMVELLQGRLSVAVMQRMCEPKTGLVPAPTDIEFDCSCPDAALMCKHVAAVLYGVGARLDDTPQLLFTLRGVDAQELIARAGSGLARPERAVASSRRLEAANLADVFGIEIAAADGTDPGSKCAKGKVADRAGATAGKARKARAKAVTSRGRHPA